MTSFFNQGFQDFMETSPRIGFQSFQGQFGDSPNQRRFFENQFQTLHNRFLGTLGQQIQEGGMPTARFATGDNPFLGGGLSEDFTGFGDFYGASPPSFAGRQQSRFSPPTQFYF